MRAREALIPMTDIVSDVPQLTLTTDGVRRAVSGCDLGACDFSSDSLSDAVRPVPERVRLVDNACNLVGIADRTTAGLLHPVVVLM